MAQWSKVKTEAENINDGNEYVNKVDSPQASDFNKAINNTLYLIDEFDGFDLALNGKVDKVAGKVLSDNNFTNAQVSAVASIASKEDSANKKTSITTGTANDTNFPTSKAVKDFVESEIDDFADTLGTASTKDTGTSSGNVPILGTGGKLAVNVIPDGVGFSGNYNDLTNKPTLGTAAARDVGVANGVAGLNSDTKIAKGHIPTGTAVGDIVAVLAGGKVSRNILPNADGAGSYLGVVAGQNFANRNKAGATYIEVLIDSDGMAYAFYPNIDTVMSDSSINCVQNNIVKAYIDDEISTLDAKIGDIDTVLDLINGEEV